MPRNCATKRFGTMPERASSGSQAAHVAPSLRQASELARRLFVPPRFRSGARDRFKGSGNMIGESGSCVEGRCGYPLNRKRPRDYW
jgi:hypothetical protein